MTVPRVLRSRQGMGVVLPDDERPVQSAGAAAETSTGPYVPLAAPGDARPAWETGAPSEAAPRQQQPQSYEMPPPPQQPQSQWIEPPPMPPRGQVPDAPPAYPPETPQPPPLQWIEPPPMPPQGQVQDAPAPMWTEPPPMPPPDPTADAPATYQPELEQDPAPDSEAVRESEILAADMWEREQEAPITPLDGRAVEESALPEAFEIVPPDTDEPAGSKEEPAPQAVAVPAKSTKSSPMRDLVTALQSQVDSQREELEARRREGQELHVLLQQLQTRALPPPAESHESMEPRRTVPTDRPSRPRPSPTLRRLVVAAPVQGALATRPSGLVPARRCSSPPMAGP